MKAFKGILIFAGILILLAAAVTGINILQKGGAWDGRSMEEILGVAPQKATLEDIRKLNKAEIFQLYYAASAPSFQEFKGEFDSHVVPTWKTSIFTIFNEGNMFFS